MTRNIRKIVSVICAVALLLSLCAVSFVGGSSAIITEEDGAIVTNTWQTDSVELDLTFDGTNKGGIAMATTSGKTIADGAFELMNRSGNYGAAWLGKDATVNSGATIPSITNLTSANTLKANLFELKSSTTYKITIKYAYRKDATTGLKLQYMLAKDPYLSSNHDRGKSLTDFITNVRDDNEAKSGTQVAGDTSYGAWNEDTYVFTTKDNLTNKYLGMRLNPQDGGNYLKIDSIKIEIGSFQQSAELKDLDNDYTFDYKTGNDPIDTHEAGKSLNAGTPHYVFSGCAGDKAFGKTEAKADGLHYFVGCSEGGNPLKYDSFGWVHNAVVYDTDAVDGGVLRLKYGASYKVTMKYKAVNLGGNSHVYIGITAAEKQGSTSKALVGTKITAADTEWQYMTVAFNAADAGVEGRYLYLGATTSGGKATEFLVESVVVEELRDVENGNAVIKYVNGDDVEYALAAIGPMTLPTLESTADASFAGWYTSADFAENTKVEMNDFVPAKGTNTLYARWSKTAAVVTYNNCGVETSEKLAVGLELPNATRPNAYLFFEGWYSDLDFTNKVTTVPDYDVTLYAKYNGTFLNFNNIAHVAGEASGTPALVKDPADANNTVVHFTAGAGSRLNMMIPAYDVAGAKPFELKTNTTYIATFKVKLVNDNGISIGCDLYQGDKSKYDANATTRTMITGAGGTATSATEWTNVTCTFTTGDTFYLERVKWSYQNHLFFTVYNAKNNAEVYLDDFSIAEALTEAPEGSVGVYFETNSKDMPAMYGFPGEAIPELSVPALGGHEFVGWYADKQLTVPFTTKFFGDKDITVYAKWKVVPFIVDFSDYENGGEGKASARAKFVKDEKGNDYLDWWVKYADSNTSDTGTPYRVFMNKGGVHYTCEKGQQYTFTFKYKLLDADVDNVTIAGVTTGKLNGWSNYKICEEKLLINKVTDDWTTASLTFTADPVGSSSKYLSFGIAGHGHILVDDIQITAAGARANLYGSTAIFFNPNGGENVDAISGDPGEKMPKLPTTTKKGYAFNGWFTDAELTTPFTAKTWGEEDMTLYAGWILGKFAESYEDFPKSALATGVSGGYSLYQDTTTGFDKANVQNGKVSIFRNGTQTGSKAFTLCRESTVYVTEGKQYTLTFYVKPSNVTDAAGTINLIGMKSNTGIAAPQSTNVIATVGDLKAGEWQKVSYTFTADSKYIGISTTAGNDMYLDNFTVTLKNYTGTTTGDNSASPILITLMIVLAAGSLVITGKKVFEK